MKTTAAKQGLILMYVNILRKNKILKIQWVNVTKYLYLIIVILCQFILSIVILIYCTTIMSFRSDYPAAYKIVKIGTNFNFFLQFQVSYNNLNTTILSHINYFYFPYFEYIILILFLYFYIL